MAIPGIDVPIINEAIRVYMDVAWGEDGKGHWPSIDFDACATAEDALTAFAPDKKAGRMRRYTLRLGNRRYPLMKLVLQELIVRDRFFFAVDTHDDLKMKESMPDYDQWLELKRFNAEVKEAVESAWKAGGVPTFSAVVAEVEEATSAGRAKTRLENAKMVLVVEDDAFIARGVSAILDGEGYRVQVVHSAEDALAWLEHRTPDLVLSDLEMPGLTGLELAARLRQDERLKALPFILATAATVDPSHFTVINAFLVKPYEQRILLKFVAEQLTEEEVDLDHEEGDAEAGEGIEPES